MFPVLLVLLITLNVKSMICIQVLLVQASLKVQQMQMGERSHCNGCELYCQETLWRLGFWAQLAW